MNQQLLPLGPAKGRICSAKRRNSAVYGEQGSTFLVEAHPEIVGDTWASKKKADPTWNRLN
jgi:hypothetical protein